MPGLVHADIQGFILRTYAMPALRVFALKVAQPQAARRFLGELVGGASENSQDKPQLATATDWTVKPLYCVNIGLTYTGLASLGLSADSLASLPEEFVAGAAARAAHVGDTGESSPESWVGQFASPNLHVLLFLFSQTEDLLEQVTSSLRAMYSRNDAMRELSLHDGRSLSESKAHFGYRDGLAQPTIEGGLPPAMPDVLPQLRLENSCSAIPASMRISSIPCPFRLHSAKTGALGRFISWPRIAMVSRNS